MQPIVAATERWPIHAAQFFLVTWVVFYLTSGLSAALYFAGDPADGPFLAFNALRRIAAGQLGGKDFVDIHGIGLPYVHYPLFAVFSGKTIAASELSRQWTSVLLFVLSLWMFARTALDRTSHVWIGAAVAVVLMWIAFPEAPGPGNLDVSARSTIPIFAFAALLSSTSDRLKAALTGCCIGLAFVVGFEHGIALVLALLIAFGVSFVQTLGPRADRTTLLENVRFCAICLGSAAFVAASLLALLGGFDGAFKAVYFNVIQMPTDQIWLFGGPPLPFVGVWRDLLDRQPMKIFAPTYVALVILGSILVVSWKRPLRIGRDWQAVASFMLIYGVLTGVPLLALLSRHYVFPLMRVLALVLLLLAAKVAGPYAYRLSASVPLDVWSRRLSLWFATVCVVGSVMCLAGTTTRAMTLARSVRMESTDYSRFMDTYWNMFMTETTRLIELKRQRSSVSIWSVYAGLLESHYQIFHPDQDYLMHALGPERWQRYLHTFRSANPAFVTTMTSEFAFEEWLENERWHFFEALLDNYEPVGRVQHANIWQRTTDEWRTPSQEFQSVRSEPGADVYALPVVSGSDRLGVVRVAYATSNRWNVIPLLGKTPRYFATLEGSPRKLPISLPPYQSEFDFPVQLPRDQTVRLRFSAASLLPGVRFQINEVRVKVFHIRSAHQLFFVPPRHDEH